jgi:hypothetical protein
LYAYRKKLHLLFAPHYFEVPYELPWLQAVAT